MSHRHAVYIALKYVESFAWDPNTYIFGMRWNLASLTK